jgi:hypothetical protein
MFVGGLAKKMPWKKIPAGVKAQILVASTARLKSGPDTKHQSALWRGFAASLVLTQTLLAPDVTLSAD